MDHRALIVDDDFQQRQYLSAILYSLGYGATTAEGEAPFDRILISAADDDTPAGGASDFKRPATGWPTICSAHDFHCRRFFSSGDRAVRARRTG